MWTASATCNLFISHLNIWEDSFFFWAFEPFFANTPRFCFSIHFKPSPFRCSSIWSNWSLQNHVCHHCTTNNLYFLLLSKWLYHQVLAELQIGVTTYFWIDLLNYQITSIYSNPAPISTSPFRPSWSVLVWVSEENCSDFGCTDVQRWPQTCGGI